MAPPAGRLEPARRPSRGARSGRGGGTRSMASVRASAPHPSGPAITSRRSGSSAASSSNARTSPGGPCGARPCRGRARSGPRRRASGHAPASPLGCGVTPLGTATTRSSGEPRSARPPRRRTNADTVCTTAPRRSARGTRPGYCEDVARAHLGEAQVGEVVDGHHGRPPGGRHDEVGAVDDVDGTGPPLDAGVIGAHPGLAQGQGGHGPPGSCPHAGGGGPGAVRSPAR